MKLFLQPSFISTSLLASSSTNTCLTKPITKSYTTALFGSGRHDLKDPVNDSKLLYSIKAEAAPTRLSQVMNKAPRWIKSHMSQTALDLFQARCAEKGLDFNELQSDTEQRLLARGKTTLAALSANLILPEYYQNPVHIPMDGVNNGHTAAIQAPAAHEGLYLNNEAIRATTFDPAIAAIKKHLKTNNNCRILFAGSGFGGDAVDFLARVKQNSPGILSKLKIDLVDLSAHFLDVGADEIPHRLQKLEIQNAPFKRFTNINPENKNQLQMQPNQVTLGYHSNKSPIQNLHLMDISAPDFVHAIGNRGATGYDVIFCLYVFHEMPEARIRATMENFSQLSENGAIYFQDMDYEKKISQMQEEGFKGQLKSFLLAQVFSGTEPYSQSPPSHKIPQLLAEYGEFTEFNQTAVVRDEATIQAGMVRVV